MAYANVGNPPNNYFRSMQRFSHEVFAHVTCIPVEEFQQRFLWIVSDARLQVRICRESWEPAVLIELWLFSFHAFEMFVAFLDGQLVIAFRLTFPQRRFSSSIPDMAVVEQWKFLFYHKSRLLSPWKGAIFTSWSTNSSSETKANIWVLLKVQDKEDDELSFGCCDLC